MKSITEIDKNFKVEATLELPDAKFYDVKQAPFRIYGLFHDGEKFRRLPESVAKTVNDGVLALHANTAGGRVRFKTDSPYVAIHAEMENIGKMGHFAACGSSGFDIYAGKTHCGSYIPSPDMVHGYEGNCGLGGPAMREITIHFPLYSNVRELYIGLSETAVVEEATPYAIEKPVVYYGSSITQGGCASRPGMAYENILSNRLSINHVNLGFSGNALGEEAIANYIAGLEMSAFVYDYDHNAPSLEHFQETHERMFKIVRSAHPDLPIIMMNRPNCGMPPWQQERLNVILQTLNNAKAAGDENVYFIGGDELLAFSGPDGTVDLTHPTDLGFFSMANAIEPVLKTVLKL